MRNGIMYLFVLNFPIDSYCATTMPQWVSIGSSELSPPSEVHSSGETWWLSIYRVKFKADWSRQFSLQVTKFLTIHTHDDCLKVAEQCGKKDAAQSCLVIPS